MKKITLALVLVLVLALSVSPVFADSSQSILSKVTGLSDSEITELQNQRVGYMQLIPASILADKLDMDIKDVIALRQAGKSYYQIAVDKGMKAEDYKTAMLEKKNQYVDEQVNAGLLTEDQGKLIKESMSTNIANCNGQTPGLGRMNGGCGMGFGGRGQGRMMGNGVGRGF